MRRQEVFGATLRALVRTAASFAILAACLGFLAVGSRASAQAPTALFFGFIALDEQPAPDRVRALVGDTVCGTAEIMPSGEGRGFYFVQVVSAGEKPGCGVEGSPVSFVLLSGALDEGTPAAQTQAWHAGTSQQLDLSTTTGVSFGAFTGELPSGGGLGLVRWTGASATPVEQAVRTVPREVLAVYYWDVAAQRFLTYIPDAPLVASTYTEVDSGDIVFVRVR